jgi:hypothetical protein
VEAAMSAGSNTIYPVTFSVDYPEEGLNRLSTALRIFYAIPILIVVGLIVGATTTYSSNGDSTTTAAGTGGILVLPTLLMILFRQKYPRWWFTWNLELLRFSNRVTAYLLLLRDEYPSTDEEQAVHFDMKYPDAENDLNRWLPLIKWLLAIPHYIVLFFLVIAVFFVVLFAWFAILFTGSYPRSLFEFVVGVMRWGNRVTGYSAALVTDRYPPFSLDG